MKMEMTDRDKKLLIMLAVFVIVVCIGYWGIYPIIKDISSINEKMQEQEDIRSMNELKLSQVALLDADNSTLEKSIVDARSAFFPVMTSAEIDRYFTDLVLSYNLHSYDLDIQMPTEETELQPYQYSEKAFNQALEDASGADTAATGTTSESGEPLFDEEVMTGIYTVNVSLRLGGSEQDLSRLIDDLSGSDKKMRVCQYAWSEERSVNYAAATVDADGEYTIQTEKVLTLKLEIYMCEE